MKFSFRKLLYGGITAVLALSLVGCAATKDSAAPAKSGGDQKPAGGEQKKETINFVYWAAAGGEEKGFKDLIADFEAINPDIKINPQQFPSGNNEYYTKIQTQIAGNESPDVFRVQYQKIGEFASQNALLDVTDLFGKDKDKFNPSLLTAVTLDGKMYGLPHHTDTLAVFYNKSMLDKLGIKPPEKIEDAWTWEQFLDVAKKIQEQKLAPYGIAFNWKDTSAYRSLPFFFQNGASLLTDDLKKGNVETPEAIETLKFLQTMFKNHMSQGNSMKGSDDSALLFTSGKAGMVINGNWMIPKWEKEMKDGDWGITFMPKKKSAASDLGGNALAIPANTKHREAAKKFLTFMGEKENMKKFVEQGLFLPSRTDIEGKFNYAIKDPAQMNKFIEQSKTVPQAAAKTVTLTSFAKINKALADGLEGLFMQGISPEETAKTLNGQINQILSEK
jgi:multiple sugar transport system substrate-binding protein